MNFVEINSEFAGSRFDKFLCKKFDISFGLAQKLIREKKLKLNGKKVDPATKISAGDKVDIYTDLKGRTQRQKQQISISKMSRFLQKAVYEDKNIIAINKPSGLAVQGGSGIDISVDDFISQKKWQLVHRLDKDTSGILLIAKHAKAADYLVQKFKDKEIQKTYRALVLGNLRKEYGTINIPLKKKMINKHEKVRPDFEEGKEAISNYKLVQSLVDYSIVELQPITGRTHQLRVHMKELGHPIINDMKYGGSKAMKKDICKRLCLHAANIEIKDYYGKKLEIFAPNFEF